MHNQISQGTPGRCSICGMELVRSDQLADSTSNHQEDQSYRPLVVILLLITLTTAVLSWSHYSQGQFSWSQTMSVFMAGFFLVFAGFKLIDLPGFAQGYSTYDLLAKRWFGYGYVYPFLELGLGLLYATNTATTSVHVATIILLSFSGLGVAQKLFRHERFHCACLGTFLKVPLTKVTLFEDFGMAAMALAMLWLDH